MRLARQLPLDDLQAGLHADIPWPIARWTSQKRVGAVHVLWKGSRLGLAVALEVLDGHGPFLRRRCRTRLPTEQWFHGFAWDPNGEPSSPWVIFN